MAPNLTTRKSARTINPELSAARSDTSPPKEGDDDYDDDDDLEPTKDRGSDIEDYESDFEPEEEYVSDGEADSEADAQLSESEDEYIDTPRKKKSRSIRKSASRFPSYGDDQDEAPTSKRRGRPSGLRNKASEKPKAPVHQHPKLSKGVQDLLQHMRDNMDTMRSNVYAPIPEVLMEAHKQSPDQRGEYNEFAKVLVQKSDKGGSMRESRQHPLLGLLYLPYTRPKFEYETDENGEPIRSPWRKETKEDEKKKADKANKKGDKSFSGNTDGKTDGKKDEKDEKDEKDKKDEDDQKGADDGESYDKDKYPIRRNIPWLPSVISYGEAPWRLVLFEILGATADDIAHRVRTDDTNLTASIKSHRNLRNCLFKKTQDWRRKHGGFLDFESTLTSRKLNATNSNVASSSATSSTNAEKNVTAFAEAVLTGWWPQSAGSGKGRIKCRRDGKALPPENFLFNTTWDIDLQKGLMYQPGGELAGDVEYADPLWEPAPIPRQILSMMDRLKLPAPSVDSLRTEYPHLWFPDDLDTESPSVDDSEQNADSQLKKGGRGKQGRKSAGEDIKVSPLAGMAESKSTQIGGQKRLRVVTEAGEQPPKRTKEHYMTSDAGVAGPIFSRPHNAALPAIYQPIMRAPGGFYAPNSRDRSRPPLGGSLTAIERAAVAAREQFNQPFHGARQDDQLSRFNSTASYFHGQAPPILHPSTHPAHYGSRPPSRLPANPPPMGTFYSGAINTPGGLLSHPIQPGLQQPHLQAPLVSSPIVQQINPNTMQPGQNLYTFSSDSPTQDTIASLFPFPVYEEDEEDDLYSARR